MNPLRLGILGKGGLYHIRGSGSRELMDSLPVVAGSDWFHYVPLQHPGFIATLGNTEFMLFEDDRQTLGDELLARADKQTKIYRRDDQILSLDGNWQEPLLQLCSLNFADVRPGEFIMANMAGVASWFRIPQDDDEALICACDPSFSHYLFDMMAEVVDDCSNRVQPT